MRRLSLTSTRAWLLVITLASFALRVYTLGAQSLWYDEGVTAAIAQRGLAELTRWTANDIQPPLYYYVVSAWGRLAGWSEWSLRFPSAFFGTLAIPLMAALAYALTRRKQAAVLAAALAAIHPLLVYYSQEARMYAMLIALCILLGVIVVRLERQSHTLLLLVLYIIVAASAVYTHYFAFFVLAALGLAFYGSQLVMLPWLRNRPAAADNMHQAKKGTLGGFVAANVIVLLLYAPWLNTLLTRLHVDASYWDGVFDLQLAIRHIGVSFVGGETMREGQAVWLIPPMLLLTLFLVARLIWRNPRQYRTALYGITWTIAPIAAVLFLASFAPKFNARYVMVALPGLLLLWSGGLAELISPAATGMQTETANPHSWRRSLATTAVVVLLVAPFFYATYSWYTDSAFTKAEWRELVDYIRNDLVYQGDEDSEHNQFVLLSGHSWPVWDYYAGDLPTIRVPDIEILDVNRVVDLVESNESLRTALVDGGHAWLVEWQGEVVDPMGIVPLQLELAGNELRVKPKYWQLQLRHFDEIDTSKMLDLPNPSSDEVVNFGNLVDLLAYDITDEDDLILMWQAHPGVESQLPDLYVTGETNTDDGLLMQQLTDQRLAGYEYPAFRWQPNQINVGRIPADDWIGAGALPNDYSLTLRVYARDEGGEGAMQLVQIMNPAGQPMNDQAEFEFTLEQPSEGPDEMSFDTYVELAQEFFAELTAAGTEVVQGELVPVEMHWYGEEKPIDDYQLVVQWRHAASHEVAREEVITLSSLPTHLWPDDEQMRTLLALQTENLAPGEYVLDISLSTTGYDHIRQPITVLAK